MNIYLGQKWTDDILSNLKAASNGYASFARPKYYMDRVDFKSYSGTVHLFDINDYDNFLKVEVADGQIVGWSTCADIQGITHGKTVRRGDYVLDQNIKYFSLGVGDTVDAEKILKKGYPENATLISGFASYYKDEDSLDVMSLRSNEKIIGFHYINAFRVLGGRNPLEYSDILDGGNNTIELTEPVTYRQLFYKQSDEICLYPGSYRYGAQPAAETLEANKEVTHNHETLTKGPLAGQHTQIRGYLYRKAAKADNVKLGSGGENASYTNISGEYFVIAFLDSEPHLALLMYNNVTYVGLGSSKSGYIVEIIK